MNLTNETLNQINEFLSQFKISSVLTQYKEIPSLDLYPAPIEKDSLQWGTPNIIFLNTISDHHNPIQNPYPIDSTYISESGVLTLMSQDFLLRENEIKQIERENFGAVFFQGYTATLLSKREYEQNISDKRALEQKAEFLEQFRSHSNNLDLYQFFKKTKTALLEKQIPSELDQWETPVFKPNNKNDAGVIVRLASPLQHNYLSLIGAGIEVSSNSLNDQYWLLDAIGHKFKLPSQMGMMLKIEGKAWLYESNGYTYICSMKQHEENLIYLEHSKQFKAFNNALMDADKLLKKEIQAEVAMEQQRLLQNLPFGYYVAIKVNVRLLTQNSWGDGAKRNTVTHIVPKEELTGRLKRKANEYLCGGKSSYGTPSEELDGILNESIYGVHMPEVTCKSCLEKAFKILDKACN